MKPQPKQTPLVLLPASLVAQVASLPDLRMVDLRALWIELVGNNKPTPNRQYMERRLAYLLQERAYRTQAPELLERNKRRIESLPKAQKPKSRDSDYALCAGTVLSREYQGVEHQVTVMADGQYEFQGRPFSSLSKIAREITGTPWSGPVFFGLKASKVKAGGRA